MNDKKASSPQFPLGMICCTPGALLELLQLGVPGARLLERHVCGDFGKLAEEDVALNHEAIKSGGRVFSCFEIGPDVKVYVITEADRSATTLLLPSEY